MPDTRRWGKVTGRGRGHYLNSGNELEGGVLELIRTHLGEFGQPTGS